MSSHVVRRAIASFFSKKTRQDLLLLYFSGHGVLDDQGQLFLAVRDTDSQLLSGTAIPSSYITTEMNNSHSQRQVLVLDCCHSGAFARGTKGQIGSSVGTGIAFEGTGYGRVVLTASDATQFAWEGEQVIGRAENSLFTHYLVEGIQTGKADLDADGQITVDELYDYTYEQVIRQTPRQTPGKWSYKEQGEIVLAKAPLPTSRGSQQVKIPDFDQDHEQRLDQLYNEGLSAFWLEEWDKAVRCFEALVELRGDYLDALNKLELSRRNKRLLALYDQAVAAGEAGDWSQAIARLEELTSTAPDYKDAAARLDKARRARQLDNLYQEARQLSQAEKWQAVANIFANIAELQPDYPDPDALLPAARLKVAEIERRQTMDDLYHRALREMDTSKWKVAQELLAELETMETGYRGAERLLAKTKSKIAEQQAIQERAGHIAGLYEQALVLLGAGQWSQALEKMGELRKLEPQFDDSEGIEKKAQVEIEREKAEAQRQIQLNASYAQAVQLLEARQYQQALEQWGQVQAIDPAYPDRKKVQATTKKKLKELTQESAPKLRLPRWAFAAIGVVGVLVVILIITYPNWGKRPTEADMTGLPAAAVPAAVPSQTVELAALPGIPTPTRTPRSTATSMPASTIVSAQTLAFPCVDVTEIPQTECEALVVLYNSTDGDNWTANTNWLVTYTPSDWFGVRVSGGHVSSIFLSDNQLTGSIPSDLGNLTTLQELSLKENQLSGSIPAELSKLKELRFLDLARNLLTGTIPSELGNLSALQDLGLWDNQLSGNIPVELGNLTALRSLGLHANRLTGTISAELGYLTKLEGLFLSGNQLTGSIPSELGNLTELQGLGLNNNQLTGTIPPELGSLTALQELKLHVNQLTGTIPPGLGSLTALQTLQLHNNQLTGTIPPELGNLTSLQELSLNNNQLTGSIPVELGSLTELQGLGLSGNQFTGSIPLSFVNLSVLEVFYFYDTYLYEPTEEEYLEWKATVLDYQGTGIVFPIVDDFNNPQYEGGYNPELWSVSLDDPSCTISQQDGVMVFSCNSFVEHLSTCLSLSAIEDFPLSGPYSLEAQFMVDEASHGVEFGPKIFQFPEGNVNCQVRAWATDGICCQTYYFDKPEELPCKTITPGTWHWIRIDLLSPNEFDFYIDREFLGTMRWPVTDKRWLVNGIFIDMYAYNEKSSTGKSSKVYVDDFSFGPLPTP
jgi:Leucine-rich repeat (LRR) protein/outer membrane protein assembly factor BamD (BamD/ComL family)